MSGVAPRLASWGALADGALRLVAVLLLGSTFAGALHDASQAWDVGYYHWPFAARLAGILPADAFVFHDANRARFDGYPLFGELAQGLLWRLTGRAEATNLVAWASVPLLAWFARRRLGAPWALAVIGLFAVPLVHTHATASYVDLPGNAALAALVLLAFEAWASDAPLRRTDIALALATAAIAVNTKALLQPIAALALVALAVREIPRLVRARAWRVLAAIAVAAPFVFATPLKNIVRHGNPYYPVRMSIAGVALEGPEEPYASSPIWLEGAPRPFRFACSLVEAGLRPMTDERRWTVDQWAPWDDRGLRMGGFFHAYVLANLGALAWRAWRDRSRDVRAYAIGFAALTAVVSVMPQSHELRYYMAWMIALVLANLRLAARPAEGARSLRAFGLVSTASLAVVLAVTRGAYAYPSGSTFAELLARRVDARVLGTIADGERVCVVREPWNVLWAAPLHPPRRFVVKDAQTAADCRDWRTIE